MRVACLQRDSRSGSPLVNSRLYCWTLPSQPTPLRTATLLPSYTPGHTPPSFLPSFLNLDYFTCSYCDAPFLSSELDAWRRRGRTAGELLSIRVHARTHLHLQTHTHTHITSLTSHPHMAQTIQIQPHVVLTSSITHTHTHTHTHIFQHA